MPGNVISGEGLPSVFDDFVGTVGGTGTSTTGALNWTNTIGTAAPTMAATSAALMALMKGIGGLSFTGSTGQLLSQSQLLNAVINPNSTTGGLGIQLDASVMLDTALPAASPSYSVFFGMGDGTTSAQNFVGLCMGWNPVTNLFTNQWGLASATIAQLIGNTAAAAFVPFGLPVALDVVQTLRVRISPDWKTIQGFVNGVAAPIMAIGSPYGGSTSVSLPAGTAYKPIIGVNCNVATMTGIVAIDWCQITALGRPSAG